MSLTAKDRSLGTSLLIFFGFLILALGTAFGLTRGSSDRGVSAPSVQAEVHATPTLPPNMSSRPSSKADRKIWLISKTVKEGMLYTLSISDMDGGNKRQLYVTTALPGQTIGLPYNTWTPDDKHIFLEVSKAGQPPTYWIFQTNGAAFSDGQQYLDVGQFWTDRKVPFTIRTATGWASETLLIIYTYKDDGSKGPAYWFDLPSKTFIQLAS